MRKSTRTIVFWLAYVAFVALAFVYHGNYSLLALAPYGAAKLTVIGVWIAFLAYTVWLSFREDLFRSIREIAKLHWGRQIGLDLYIGFSLALALIGLTSGWSVMLLWLLPVYVFGNLATLLYIVLEWNDILGRLAG